MLNRKFDGRWRWAALAFGLAVSGLWIYHFATLPLPVKTLVVLPFENQGDSKNQRFCDGLQETVTGILASAPELKPHFLIVPSARVRSLNILTKSEALHQLKADLVISGTLRSTAADLQIGLVLTSTWRMRVRDSLVVTVPINIAPAQLKRMIAEKLGAMLIRRPTVSGS